MSFGRLAIAQADGILPHLDGCIVVNDPPSTESLQGFVAASDITCVTSSYKHNKALLNAGYATAQHVPDDAAHFVIHASRSKAETQNRLIEAAAQISTGWIVLDGQKTDGIDSYLKWLKGLGILFDRFAKMHGKTIWFRAEDAGPLRSLPLHRTTTGDGWVTAPGVFSADGVDPASTLLCASLPDQFFGNIADLGAGWGYLSAQVAKKLPQDAALHLVEDNLTALNCAKQNVADPRAQFHWADATQWAPIKPLQTVVMNPPFHTGRKADPDLGRSFIQSAARMLAPQGHLWMVANAHLPYEGTLESHFNETKLVVRTNSFKVLHASRPRRQKPNR